MRHTIKHIIVINIKRTFVAVMLSRLYVLTIELAKPIVVYQGKNTVYRFI